MVRERAGEFGLCFGAARNERRRIRGSSDPRTYRPYFRTLKDPVVVNTETGADRYFCVVGPQYLHESYTRGGQFAERARAVTNCLPRMIGEFVFPHLTPHQTPDADLFFARQSPADHWNGPASQPGENASENRGQESNSEQRSDQPFLHRGCCENLHRLPCCFLTAQRSWAAGLGYTFSGTTKGARYSRVSSWLAC